MTMMMQNLGAINHILPKGFNPIEFVGDGMNLANKFQDKMEKKLTAVVEPIAEKWEKNLNAPAVPVKKQSAGNGSKSADKEETDKEEDDDKETEKSQQKEEVPQKKEEKTDKEEDDDKETEKSQ